MVGGASDADLRIGEPIPGAMGKRIVRCGEAGTSQAAKIYGNMILGISMISVSEAFVLAEEAQPVAPGAVRCRPRRDLVRPMLVADQLLSVPGPVPARPPTRATDPFRGRAHAEGPEAFAGRPRFVLERPRHSVRKPQPQLYGLFKKARPWQRGLFAIINMLRGSAEA